MVLHSSRPQIVALSLLILCLVLSSLSLTGHAIWPFGKPETQVSKPSAPTTPPPADMGESVCEPYKQKIMAITRQGKVSQAMNTPRKTLLITRHQKCLDRYRQQEINYLKNAPIQGVPEADWNWDKPEKPAATQASPSTPAP